VQPRWAIPGHLATGRRIVMVAIDNVDTLHPDPDQLPRNHDDVDQVLTLTVPDAWALVQQLQRALSYPTAV
jgi:hypothetical protein